MKSLFNIALTAVIALALAGCKVILPTPTSEDSTLILAPYAADNKTKSKGAWAYAYVLNNDENLLIKINPRKANDTFTITENLSAGEYAITGIKTYPVSGGRTKAIGKGDIVQLEKEHQIEFSAKPGEITILPLIITFFMETSPDGERMYQQRTFDFLTDEELTNLRKETETLEGFDAWSNKG